MAGRRDGGRGERTTRPDPDAPRRARRSAPTAGRTPATDEPPAGRRAAAPGGRAVRRVLVPTVLVGLTALVLGAGVLPTRTYLDKQAELRAAEQHLADLRAANAEAEAQAALLDTDAEIERRARDEFGLARPGEETYVVLPAPQPPVEVPDGWPFEHVGPALADG